MRNFILLGIAWIAACSSAVDAPKTSSKAARPKQAAAEGDEIAPGFKPPAAADGYTRIVAPVVEGLAPGSDVTYCQYVHGPFDTDMDVLDVGGYQSRGGHHAVAYASTVDVPLGTSRPCNQDDNLSTSFIGGVGGEGGGGVKLPPNVAFRLPKGNSIMLNTHFLNTTDETLDGHSVVDFKFVPADGQRTIAAFFANGNIGFNLPPHEPTDIVTECTLPRDMEFILFTNHMHDHGASAQTEVVHADDEVEMVHEDPTWTYEMQFKAVYTQWPLEAPFVVAKGEKLRTRCSWRNTSDTALGFPREMCFGIGFFLSDGSSAPVCINGTWRER